MYPKLVLSISIGLVVAAGARANAPLPKSLKFFEPPVRFEGIDKHADHVFHMRYVAGIPGYPGPPKLVEVRDSKEIKIDGIHIWKITLLAVERKEFEKRAKDDPKLDWLTEKSRGVLAVDVEQPSTTMPKTLKSPPVTTYRVSLNEGKLKAEKFEEKNKSSGGPGLGLLPIWALGIVCSVSLSWLGIWGARRRPSSR